MSFLGHFAPSRRAGASKLADYLVVAVALALPWSTSATGIFIALWLLVVLATIDYQDLRAQIRNPVIIATLGLFALGVVGMAWAFAVPLSMRLHGAESYLRLLAIPLLVVQFRHSERAHFVLLAFLASCTALLVVSFVMVAFNLPSPRGHGIPVKSYIQQSAEFMVCGVALLYVAAMDLKANNKKRAFLFALVGLLFFANIVYVATSRTTLLTLPLLLLIAAAHGFGKKGFFAALVFVAVLPPLIWFSSPYLKQRVSDLSQEAQLAQVENPDEPASPRSDLWRKAVRFIADAPIIGHGTGSITGLYKEAAAGKTGIGAQWGRDAHNMTLTIAIQLGFVGALALWLMWGAAAWTFLGTSFVSLVGLIFVVQHVVGSLFNSSLFDFTPGWLYVFAVGTLAGTVSRERAVNRQRV